MTYRQDKKRNIKKVFFGWVIVLVFVYIVLFTNVFGVISSSSSFVAVPIWKFQNNISNTFNNISLFFKQKKDLESENQNLKSVLQANKSKLLDRNLLYKENIKLKELLGRKIQRKDSSVLAYVLTRPNQALYDTVVVDVGAKDGVKKGDNVLYGDNIIIGKIVSVFSNSSKVLLASSPGEKINIVVGDNNIPAVAYGRGGGNFEFKTPRDVKISIGDLVLVPGIKMQTLGVVGYIESKPSDPFKTIIFNGPVNIFQLKLVEVDIQGK